MVKRLLILLSMMALSLSSFAQTDRFEQRYNLLVSKFGPAGVGVETLLDNWEAADSADARVHLARFQFWMEKAKTEQIVSKAEKKYLGMSPLFSLKDSTVTDVHYYQETFYDDEMYGKAIKAVDKTIALRPSDLEYRFMKANAYIAYEKGSPDMALVYLQRLADMHGNEWNYNSQVADEAFFADAMQEYCYSFYTLGTPAAMEAFRALSETMGSIYPDNADFMNNIGAYWLVGMNDSKKALKQYQKVLKKFPGDMTAIKNCVIISRRDKNTKSEIKYLKLMEQYGEDSDRASAQLRIKALESR